MSVDKTLEERGARYGSFEDHARICQALKDTMVFESVGKFKALPADMRQALEVIQDKVARILSGDPYYIDNWHDIQGYAKLIENRLQEAMDRPSLPKEAKAEPAIEALKEDATGKPIAASQSLARKIENAERLAIEGYTLSQIVEAADKLGCHGVPRSVATLPQGKCPCGRMPSYMCKPDYCFKQVLR